jgi:ADP-ribose pyrophosphatase YjhB (NUDIX family)
MGTKILLCKRAIEPRLGFWTVPAGFMENGETMQAAAARECYEEALARVEIGSLLAVVNVTRANQVHVMFRAKMLTPKFASGHRESGGGTVRGVRDSLGSTWLSPAANILCANISRTAPPVAKIITSRN